MIISRVGQKLPSSVQLGFQQYLFGFHIYEKSRIQSTIGTTHVGKWYLFNSYLLFLTLQLHLAFLIFTSENGMASKLRHS